jgi:RHS repeat-associated protein
MGGLTTIKYDSTSSTSPAQCRPIMTIGIARDTTRFGYGTGAFALGNSIAGRPTRVTAPVGTVDTVTYQSATWNTGTHVRAADGASSTLFFNKFGRVDSLIDPAAIRTAFRYDTLGRVTYQKVGTSVQAPVTRTHYLPGGLVDSVQVYAANDLTIETPLASPAIQTTRYFYNRLGEQDSVLSPGDAQNPGRRITYALRDNYGSPLRVGPGNGSGHGVGTDWQGRPAELNLSRAEPGFTVITGETFATTAVEALYNAVYFGPAQLSPGQDYQFKYDNKGRRIESSHVDGYLGPVSLRRSAYSRTGAMVADTLTFLTDSLRMVRRYQYNRRGQRVLAADSLSLLSGVAIPGGEQNGRIAYFYKSTTALLDSVQAFADSAGTSIQTTSVTFTYGRGSRDSIRIVKPNPGTPGAAAVKTVTVFDNVGRVRSLTTSTVGGTTWYDANSLSYNLVDALGSLNEAKLGQSSSAVSYTYATNGTRRLTQWTNAGPAGTAARGYQYDVFGNRVWENGTSLGACNPADTATYGPDNRILIRRDLQCHNYYHYWFDNAGNRLGSTDTLSGFVDFLNNKMTYTATGQLAFSMTRTGGGGNPGVYDLNWHWYDADGRRIMTEVEQSSYFGASTQVPGTGVRSYYFYDGSDVALVVGRVGSSWSVRQRMLSVGVDQPMVLRSRLGNAQTLVLVADRQGGTVAAVRWNGTQETTAKYYAMTPFGSFEAGAGVAGGTNTETGFTGASTPNSTGGFTYLRNRWYDPQTGRFLTQDPIGLAGGVNLYAYAGNNPVSFSDPFGLTCEVKGHCTQSDVGPPRSGVVYRSLATAYGGVTGADVSYFMRHPVNAIKADRLRERAAFEAGRVVELGRIPGGEAGMHNGPGDAVRHATGSCLMTRELGAETAKTITDGHENDDTTQPVGERQMDQANNQVGRSVAPNPGSCIDNVVNAYGNGDLTTTSTEE